MKSRQIAVLTGAGILCAVGSWMWHSVPFIIFMTVLGGVIGWDIGKNS